MNDLQQQASNPEYSVWVSASAGTGKTKILTDRVLRLIISGMPFEKILCLTFTNAAANEMQSRIRSKLAYFSSSETNLLIKELSLLLAKEPSRQEIQTAKILYHKLLNSYEGISIYTIHAFCQKMLKLFSFEAGINQEFKILDEITAKGILEQLRNQIYLDPEYTLLIDFFLTNFHDVTINDIFLEIIQKKIKFKKLFTKKMDNTETNIEKFSNFSVEDPLKQHAIFDKTKELLLKYSVNIIPNQEILQFFLTQDFTKRKNILPKSIATKHPELLKELEDLQEKVFCYDQQKKIAEMKNYSDALTLLAKIFLSKYDAYKARHNLLDYDDLIYYTQLLLNDKDTRNWILYKQSGGISHLLVDEAQDTSDEQWQIITAIIAEFHSSTKHNNSIFVVGDEKQSIFSFQGADLDSFTAINKNLAQKFSAADKEFKNITLEWSYRSTPAIIDIVYIILEQIKNTNPTLFPSTNPKILPFRKNHKGRVELWPLEKAPPENQLFWPLPHDYNKSISAKTLLAEKIASFIKQQILTKQILPATNLLVKESDFMILVRKRDELVLEIINTLKHYGLSVEDIDKVNLNQNLSVMDLISVAKFVILPQDDLNLASLLKSPIIGMKEEELQNLAIARGNNTLWEYLSITQEYINISNKLNHFVQIYKISHVGNFFPLIVDCFDIRKILVENNGFDSNDLINELIYLSVNYAEKKDISLQSFVYWFENNNIEIKRNLEGSSKIKIMTVHASKGLQAPIVILCDTTSLPTNSNKFIWDQNGEIFAAMQATNSPEFFKALKEQQQLKDMQEYIRLLYVAMTRAEDHLIICGYQEGSRLPQNCWYELISKSMSNHGKFEDNNVIVYETPDKIKKQLLKAKEHSDIIPTQAITVETTKEVNIKKPEEFFFNEVLFNRVIKPTKKNYAITSPLLPYDHLEYGKIFHKILEDAAKASKFEHLSIHPFIKNLPLHLQVKICNNIDKLLNNKEFMLLSSQELKTEVTIGVNLDNNIKIGRIDLLAINDQQITIIDYKTDINPPTTMQLVNTSYIDQLNFYRHMTQKLYPDKEVICKILWLESANLMTITI